MFLLIFIRFTLVPARIIDLGRIIYIAKGSELELKCRTIGDPSPSDKWFLNGREEAWMSRQNLKTRTVSAFADSGSIFNGLNREKGLIIRDVDEGNTDGNYTCYTENKYGSDSTTYQVRVQVPPEPANLHILQTSSHSISVRWRVMDDGHSPVNKIMLNYKMTYGEWAEKELAWHKDDYTLKDLHCGREYHLYVVLFNALGASSPSEVLTARTLGSRPTGPTESDLFIEANTTFLTLKLDSWSDHRCDILYFVVEYKLASSDSWTTGNLTFLIFIAQTIGNSNNYFVLPVIIVMPTDE